MSKKYVSYEKIQPITSTNRHTQFQLFYNQFLIGVCPVTLLCGGLTLIDFGFAAFFNVFLTVFLQEPIAMGGYGFTPVQNAECKTQPMTLNALIASLRTRQSSSASGSASSLHSCTDISQMTVSPSGSVTEMAASGSPSTDYTRSGYQASSSSQFLLASTEPPCNTTCTTWSSRSPTFWVALRQMPSYR